MQLTSAAFRGEEEIPSQYTSDGENVSPELSWRDAPLHTQSFVLIMHDPDAPRSGGFTHWVVYNMAAGVGHLEPKVPRDGEIPGVGMQGRNDADKVGYFGPAPPSGTHRYFFRLYALNTMLDLPPGATHHLVQLSMKGHVLAETELMGTYEKKSKQVA